MEHKRSIILLSVGIFLCCCHPNRLKSQSGYQNNIYEYYINGNMDKWSSVISDLEKKQPLQLTEQLRLLGYYYGYTGFLTGKNRKKDAGVYIGKAEKIIDEKLKNNPSDATLLAYKGSFLGYKIMVDKKKKFLIGPKSMKYIKKAYETDPENLQAIVDMANFLYYAPGAFGGNKQRAIELYEKAIRKMENTNADSGNWFYLHLLIFLAKHHTEMGNRQKAEMVYDRIRKKEPLLHWIDNKELLNAYFTVDY